MFLDIAANIGKYSIMITRKGLKCHAFEPMSGNYEAVFRNIRLNDLGNEIHAHNIALGCEECSNEFIYEMINNGASMLAIFRSDFNSPEHCKSIVISKVSRLDVLSANTKDCQ